AALTCSASMTSCAFGARGPSELKTSKNSKAWPPRRASSPKAAPWEAPAARRPSVIGHLFAGEKGVCAAMRGHGAAWRCGGGRKPFGVGGERLRQEVSMPGHEIRAADEHVAAERDDDPQRRFMDVGERRLREKERLGAVGLHDRDILLIGRDQNADAARVRGADEL